MTIACAGIGVGTGVAIGNACMLNRGPVCVTPSWVAATAIEAEIERFEAAVRTAALQLQGVREQIPPDTPAEISEFIDTHLLMLQDKALSGRPIQMIRTEGTSAEWALQQHRDALIRIFEDIEDSYLRMRRDDLDHVVNRILSILLEQHQSQFEELRHQIVLAEDLTPADIIMMKKYDVAGFATDYGGPMSHTAILARSLGIPAVVGARAASRCLQHGEPLVLDASTGILLADCDEDVLAYFAARQAADASRTAALRRRGVQPAITQDGEQIQLLANIELVEDVDTARVNGAQGIGLYRTEFLYMNRDRPPSEEEHFDVYRVVLEGMQGQPVTIRTLDLGADKQPGAATTSAAACNPALGLRAIRLCLKEPELFYPQIRAILRASAFGKTRIMLPMLTNVWEIEQAVRLIRQAMQHLEADGIAYDPQIPIGGMIEVPAAALCARAFATRLDFMSLGTNDLVQYTLAIDRVDDEVNYLYDPVHPAVLRLIHEVIAAGIAADIPVSMCGEMAGDERFVPLLLGMGLREFSMQPAALLDVHEQIRKLDVHRLTETVRRAMIAPETIDPSILLEELDRTH
ncbi:MAG: phosphoenolpyruvate--protein phosphotransferase [Sedimenticolaceae bacterium]